MLPPILRIAAAQDKLGVATAENLINAADQLLNQGIYSYSLGRLGTYPNPQACPLAEVRPLFLSALKELGVPAPSTESAVCAVLRPHVEAIVEGACAPADGVGRLERVCRQLQYRWDKRIRATLDACGYESLAGLYWDYDMLLAQDGHFDSPEDRARAFAAFDDRVLQAGTRWLRQYALPEMHRRYVSFMGGTALQLARTIRETRDFEAIPVLADALEEAGCSEAELLEHFRYPGLHVRCCWLIDWLLSPG